jgi:fructokinase
MGAVIVVAGEALIDLIAYPDGRLAAVPGGGPFNASRTIARLGGDVAFLGRLSEDRFGQQLRGALAGDGVDLSFTETTDQPTTLAVAELDDRGAATYRFHTADTSVPGLSAAAIERALASAPTALHVGTLGLALEPMASGLARAAAAAGPETVVMLDPNCRPRAIRDRDAYLARLDAVLRRADVVKVSADDLAWLAPGVSFHDAARRVLDQGPAVVLATDGAQCVIVLGRRFAFEVTVPRVDVVDTVGAGDAFGGAFLAWWTERGFERSHLGDEDAVRDAVTHAVAVAALTCQRAGAEPPTRAEAGW